MSTDAVNVAAIQSTLQAAESRRTLLASLGPKLGWLCLEAELQAASQLHACTWAFTGRFKALSIGLTAITSRGHA